MFYSSAFVARAPKGKGWRCVLAYKDGNKWRQRSRLYRDCTSKRQAKQLLAEFRAEMESAVHEPTSNELVLNYARNVVDKKLELSSIQPATAADYHKSLNAWSKYLDGIALDELDRKTIERSLLDMSRDVSSTTVLKRYIALNMVLDSALKTGDLIDNPMKGIPRPKKALSAPNALVGQDLERLSEDLPRLPMQDWVIVVALCFYAGLRSEETGGLTYNDIDLDRGTMWIRRAIAYGQKGSYVSTPKNGKSRDVPISSALKAILTKWIDTQGTHDSSDYLLGGKHYIDVRAAGRKWSAYAGLMDYKGLAGKKPTLHDLRHTFATACIKGGMDIKTLQSLLGHSSAAVTLDIYASCDPAAKAASAAIIDSVL